MNNSNFKQNNSKQIPVFKWKLTDICHTNTYIPLFVCNLELKKSVLYANN